VGLLSKISRYLSASGKDEIPAQVPSLPIEKQVIKGTKCKSFFFVNMAKNSQGIASLAVHVDYPLFPAEEGYSFANTYEEGLSFVFGNDPYEHLRNMGVSLVASVSEEPEGNRFGGWIFSFFANDDSVESLKNANAACDFLFQYFSARKNVMDLGVQIAFGNYMKELWSKRVFKALDGSAVNAQGKPLHLDHMGRGDFKNSLGMKQSTWGQPSP
jgi:hypothetical protein